MARGAREFRDDFRYDRERQEQEQRLREQRERDMDRAFQEQQQRDDFEREQLEREMAKAAQEEAIRRVVNDPDIIVNDTLRDIINDPTVTMDRDMTVRRNRLGMRRPMTGRQIVRQSGQFANLALGVDLPGPKKKRTRKKSKTDGIMRKALAQANAELRKKNGQLRKGVTQSQIMKRAHRIRRKMS